MHSWFDSLSNANCVPLAAKLPVLNEDQQMLHASSTILQDQLGSRRLCEADLTNSVMASLARSVPRACACLAALEAASLTAAGAGCQSGGPYSMAEICQAWVANLTIEDCYIQPAVLTAGTRFECHKRTHLLSEKAHGREGSADNPYSLFMQVWQQIQKRLVS